MVLQGLQRPAPQIEAGVDAQTVHFGRCDGSDAVEASDRQMFSMKATPMRGVTNVGPRAAGCEDQL